MLAIYQLHCYVRKRCFFLITQEQLKITWRKWNYNTTYYCLQELTVRLPQFEQSNLSKLQAVVNKANEIYELTIRNISKNQPLCLHPLDLEAVHNEAAQAAMKTYDGSVKKISNKPDQKRAELAQVYNFYMSSFIYPPGIF